MNKEEIKEEIKTKIENLSKYDLFDVLNLINQRRFK